MISPLRIVYLEDDPGDVRLVRDALKDDGLCAELTAVDSRDGFVAALEHGADLILADYSLPTFDGLEALHLHHARYPHRPFIFVTGALGEERAIEMLKSGATDYVLKDRLARLSSAVRRAMSEAEAAAERQRAEEALKASQERLELAASGTGIGMFDWNIVSGEIHWTDQHARLWGRTSLAPSYAYRDWTELIHPDDLACAERDVRTCIDERSSLETEYRIVRQDGTVRWIVSRGVVQYDAQGKPQRMLGTVQDITERVRSEEALEAAKAAAEAANRAKSQFLANMSHELRTPLNAILGMTELALGEELSPTLREYLQTAKQSADGLLELLNQVLDLSRIEAGAFQLESTPFDLCKTVEQVVKTLSVRAHEKGLKLLCDLSNVPTQLVGDPLRLRQVLMNLAGNAIKFTSKGEVVVSVAVQAQPGAGSGERGAPNNAGLPAGLPAPCSPLPPAPREIVLEFSVKDTGIGIAAEDLERIFAPFTQADASTTRQYGGSGLGLTITRQLVSLMGGRTSVESKPGKGSTFRFTACFVLRQEAEEESAIPAVSRDALRDLPVLIVAENVTSGRILAETFRRWSMKPETANDVPAALAKTHKAASDGRKFRLILVDAMMPGIDGFTFAEWLRHDANLAGPVILMLSAPHRRSQVQRCQDLGMLSMETPISQSALFNLVAEALGIQQQAVKAAESGPADISGVPARLLRVLLAEDTRANQKLVAFVLNRRGHQLEVAQNGQEALDAIERQDFDVVLMDVQMPILDGFRATQAIRNLSDPKKARLPIIAMTAQALKGDAERCLAAGMDGYISKPVKASELIEMVERLAERPVEQPAAVSTLGPPVSLALALPPFEK